MTRTSRTTGPTRVEAAVTGDPLTRSRAGVVAFDSAAGAGFEAVLAAAASHGIGGLLPTRELGRLVSSLVRDPAIARRRLGSLAADAVSIARGMPSDAAEPDRRFTDRAWRDNALLNRLARIYLASCNAAHGIVADAELDWRTRERLQMPVDNLLAALAPTNNPLTNPECWKEVIDTGGASLLSGVVNLINDLNTEAKLPSSVDSTAYIVGETIAATPGKVVRRERLYELLQYAPQSETVDAVAVVMVPSPVNKYYLLDLDPDNSLVAAQLRLGRQVFVPSWVNPNDSHADVGFDQYVASIVEILDTVAEISGQRHTHLLGLCGGGQLALMSAAYLAAVGRQDRIATLTIGIALVDFERGPTTMAFLDRTAGERAIKRATANGYFKASDSARSFALMRPADGIWNNVVNNYVLGRRPPKMALLYWAADQTNMATRFGTDMILTALTNALAVPRAVTILGEPIDLKHVTVDTYVLGASTDHISPWKDCYRTVDMVSGPVTFVLAAGGHAMAISRPPGRQGGSHWTAEITGSDPDAWLSNAQRHQGSWWNHWNSWIQERTPETRPATDQLGSATYPPLGNAPGDYVRVMS
jgi:polyhydroxyalkanoate synthase